MSRPLKNTEITHRLSTLDAKVDQLENKIEKQRKLSFVIGLLLVCLGGLLVF